MWWIDLPLAKIGSDGDIDLLLFDAPAEELHHLRVPTAYLRANLSDLSVRPQKNCIHLELSAANPNRFLNVTPASSKVEFSQFLQRTF